MLNLDFALLKVALLTIAIEVPIFYLGGYKQVTQLVVFATVNLVSNLLLNEALPAYTPGFKYWLILAVGELLVVALEYALMLYVVKEQKFILFKTILLSNIASLLIGLVLLFQF